MMWILTLKAQHKRAGEGRAAVAEGWLGPSSAGLGAIVLPFLESRALEAARGQAAYHGEFQMSEIL